MEETMRRTRIAALEENLTRERGEHASDLAELHKEMKRECDGNAAKLAEPHEETKIQRDGCTAERMLANELHNFKRNLLIYTHHDERIRLIECNNQLITTVDKKLDRLGGVHI
ncbi:unnamed protein product [Hyaloperonospora brassicae]|uniref:Uncharacterized protein n=1 Tax=Hyaloperonospora brassicae TaxID=162125 RepID=A0AAV0TU85_HYABA|nr:unnamed protein product [Hyaloperonospora brassicae]